MSVAGARIAVTGASSGVGAAVARELTARGAAVVGLARRRPTIAGVDMRSLDVTDEAATAAAFAAIGPLDGLVLAHGDGTFAPLTQTTTADVRAMLDAHVLGTLHCLREAQFATAARVWVISSVAVNTAFSECSGYTAAKAGQAGLVRAAATELAPRGVLVTRVILGATDTPIWDSRPAFDRSKMMKATDVAQTLADLIQSASVYVEELVLLPAAGRL